MLLLLPPLLLLLPPLLLLLIMVESNEYLIDRFKCRVKSRLRDIEPSQSHGDYECEVTTNGQFRDLSGNSSEVNRLEFPAVCCRDRPCYVLQRQAC